MIKQNMKLCVSCFTYNQSRYIVDAMNGFTMQQTSFPFVCIVMDDASTDGETEVIKKYINQHFEVVDNMEVKEDTDDYVMTLVRHKKNQNC